jgi:hypothetical protein
MNRILILLAGLVLAAPYQAARADSQLRDFFPRYAEVQSSHLSMWTVELKLKRGDVVLDLEGLIRGRLLIEDVRSVYDARTRHFSTSGDEPYTGSYVRIEGTLDRFTLTYNQDQFVVHPMSREKFAEYLEARRNNVGQPFDSNEWLEKNSSSGPSISAQVPTPSPESDDNNILPPTTLPPCPTSGRFHNCYGTFIDANGDKYVGEWKDGKIHGQGTFTTAKGAKYVGEVKDNRLHGLGIYTFANGKMFVGVFRDGPWTGIGYSASGRVLYTYSNGVSCTGCEPTARQLALVREINSGQISTTPTPQPTPTPEPTPDPAPTSEPTYRLIGTGTGFVVNQDYVVTAEHVLDGCNAVSIAHNHKEFVAQTVSRNVNNDLGLLKIEKPMANIATLRGSPDLRVGDAAINYGYPLFGELSDSAKLNAGYVNSLAGYNNDSAVIQYSAPTQPGNSGGPVLDQSGNVIGVVSSGLSKRYAEESGHIAQNVNFAIKSTILEGFLKANKVSYEKADSTEELKLPDIAEKAETFTVLVGCWE